MRAVRTRISASNFKIAEKQGDICIARWDASPEMIPVYSNRQISRGRRGKNQEEAQEELKEMKESGYILCSEAVYRTLPPKEYLQDDIQADLEIRYPEGNAPTVDVAAIYELLSK